jgi:glycerophosphoryl diester phosphodiesterase
LTGSTVPFTIASPLAEAGVLFLGLPPVRTIAMNSPAAAIVCVLLLTSGLVHGDDAPRSPAASAPLHLIDPQTPHGLQELFRHGEPLPFVSAHRGGAWHGSPENCIATFEHTLRSTYAILEIDSRYAKDGAIVVHHDATLERTTTGHGRVIDFTVEELKTLRLKDLAGNVTDHQIPTLDEVLEWARGKTVVVLDQKDVPFAERVKKIEEHHAEGYALLIVYSFNDVQACYRLNPSIMMEVMIPNREKVAEFDRLGVPWSNVIPFVGHIPPEDTLLYEEIHARGANCMIGTSRNLDRRILTGEVTDIRKLEPDYRRFLNRGADLIETDIPTHLGPMLYEAAPAPRSKKMYFRTE